MTTKTKAKESKTKAPKLLSSKALQWTGLVLVVGMLLVVVLFTLLTSPGSDSERFLVVLPLAFVCYAVIAVLFMAINRR